MKVITILVTVMGGVVLTQALSCFVCFPDDEFCTHKKFDKSEHIAAECPNAHTCEKIEYSKGRVYRGCGPANSTPAEECEVKTIVDVDITTCYCTGDQCNDAGYTEPSTLLLLLPLSLFGLDQYISYRL